MTPERYKELNRTGEELAPEEVREGWHYCADWDGLLIHPKFPEAECCSCEVKREEIR